jgi:hypothetical protein
MRRWPFETHAWDHVRFAKRLPGKHGWATRKASQDTHDFKGSARPLISGGTIPRNQQRDTTQHVGRKSAMELLFLVHIFMSPFVACVSMLSSQVSCHK